MNEELILRIDNGWPTFRGSVVGDSLVFEDGLGSFEFIENQQAQQ